MNLLIFGGTTEGRLLAEKLSDAGISVTVSCATPLGGEELRGIPCRVLCGRLTLPEIQKLARAYDLVADATHPYAKEVTANIRAACESEGIPLRRILRGSGEADACLRVPSCRAAAELLLSTQGNILIATGAKELADYAALPPERLYARVLPTHAGIDACEAIGLPHSHVIALYGPFTQEMNEAMLRQYDIRWMVTKESGGPGGYAEKLAAAQAAGAGLIVVERPAENGISMEEFIREVKTLCRLP